MAESISIAVAQFAPGDDVARNLNTIQRLAEQAVRGGARMVLFPEYSSFFVHPVGAAFVDAAEPLDGLFVARLGELARRLGVHLVAGMAERADAHPAFSNTIVALAPSGALEAVYRKQHLYDAFGARESDWVRPGALDAPQLFTVDGLLVGIQTCYDLRFPELTRVIVDAGAELVVVPSEWVRGPQKEHHWRTLVTARAIENTVYVAAADHTPPIGVGTSMIVDPMGMQIAGIAEQEDIALAAVSRARVMDVRATNPALSLRRYRVERADALETPDEASLP